MPRSFTSLALLVVLFLAPPSLFAGENPLPIDTTEIQDNGDNEKRDDLASRLKRAAKNLERAFDSLLGHQRGPKIGVVDMEKVTKNYWKYRQLKAGLEKDKKKIQSELTEMKKELQKLMLELRDLNPKSRLYKNKKKRAYLLQARFKRKLTGAKKGFQEKAQKATRKILDETSKIVVSYGRRHGYDFIFRMSPQDSLNVTPSHLKMLDSLLYHHRRYDITDKIVAVVSKKWPRGARQGHALEKMARQHSQRGDSIYYNYKKTKDKKWLKPAEEHYKKSIQTYRKINRYRKRLELPELDYENEIGQMQLKLNDIGKSKGFYDK